ncbi:MAG: DMT family transporter [Syntrophaceticus sp.]|jgi:paired small multidrug resistance pump
MAWIYVIIAGFVEIFWVIGLRYSQNLWQWAGTIIFLILSFYLIIKACESLPSGSVYAVFTGIGAASIVLIDIVVFHTDFSLIQVLMIGLIVLGVVGLKLTTVEKDLDSKPAVEIGEENK